jgi:hypothetical protein
MDARAVAMSGNSKDPRKMHSHREPQAVQVNQRLIFVHSFFTSRRLNISASIADCPVPNGSVAPTPSQIMTRQIWSSFDVSADADA